MYRVHLTVPALTRNSGFWCNMRANIEALPKKAVTPFQPSPESELGAVSDGRGLSLLEDLG